MYRSALIALDREDEAGSKLMGGRCRALIAGPEVAIHLVHVRTPLPRSYLAELPKNWEANEQSSAEKWLTDFAERYGLSVSLAGVHAPYGSIAREVVKLAEALEVETICVTAHKLDLGRLLLGTNTHAIVRDAPCDVIVVR
ncbi:universal stress protein [Erythrobacter rubeus]|uniref:Universal stress protein n=1 Tax=Erythrobacter rubeus TaxID=2760803 RepID=A0ABR8KWZ0_9SPHN|nr:universal stress protein [Erythrobacter rubeus]MBD2842726.1 universal stress protein [Erythrobacter rubeus]